MEKKMYQVHIELKGSKPKIWRRILVDSDVLLPDFHKILQTTMGWSNAHLHSFSDGKVDYAPKEMELDYAIDSRKVRLDKILKSEKAKINYSYDFGDGWEHSITLEKILAPDTKLQIPKCTAGKSCCPPEDCGGIWGYYNMLEILKQPEHEEYEDYIDWIDDDFDPEYFDLVEINEMLQEEDFGCFSFF